MNSSKPSPGIMDSSFCCIPCIYYTHEHLPQNYIVMPHSSLTPNTELKIHSFNKYVMCTYYDLNKAEERAHILEGLLIALDNIDEVIRIIRGSKTVADAKEELITRFSLTEVQAQAIVDMRLRALTRPP